MSKSDNIKLFTEILSKCEYDKQDENIKKQLQQLITSLLKTAQENCIQYLVQFKEEKKKSLSKEELKKEARALMHKQLELLLINQEFLSTCHSVINSKIKIKNSEDSKIINIAPLINNKISQNQKKSHKPIKKKTDLKLQSNLGDYHFQNYGKYIEHTIPKFNASQKDQLKPISGVITEATKSTNGCSNGSPSRTQSYTSCICSNINKTTILDNSIGIKFSKSSKSLSPIKNKRNISPKSMNVRESRKSIISIPFEVSTNLQGANLIRFSKIKELVDTAIKTQKTFMIFGYGLPRRFLLNRGWVEKIVTSKNSQEIVLNAEKKSLLQLFNLIDDPSHGYLYTRMLKSKLLGNNPCDLIWDPKPPIYNLIKNVKKPIYLNHFKKRGQYDFCSKIGLCRHMRNLKWNYRHGFADVYFPRTYILSDNEMNDFIYDFRITACMALLKWTVNRSKVNKPIVARDGKVPIDAFFFAILQCIGYIKHCKDCEFRISYSVQTWSNFLDHYYQCVYKDENFYSADDSNVADMIAQATEVLARIRVHRPELNFEGNYNVWILKPDQHSRGQGIHVCRKLNQIKELVNKNSHLRYLVQKYIENPLIIYNTKFDIRQWFLVSSTSPLTVWIYEECYLRFSSQQYDLTKCHESIHLTNNSVQCRYKNNNGRDRNLPRDNMWDSNRFDTYLKSIGHPEAWNNIIYPKMKQAIMAVILSAKDDMEKRKHTFELYGADFMLTSDFQPWLIEVNSHPAMCASTSVTARMCPEVIENVLDVVFGKYPANSNTKNKFELIYKEEEIEIKPSDGLYVYGTPLPMKYYTLIDEAIKARTSLIIQKTDSNELLQLTDNTNKKNVAFYKNNFTLESLPNAMEKQDLITMSSIHLTENNNGDPITSVDNQIEVTRKIVHMQSILSYLMKLLNRERLKRSIENKSPNNNNDNKQFSPIINEQDIESTIEDIQNTIDSLVNGKVLNKSSINLSDYVNDEHSVLANKSFFSPKTLANIITILTVGLYEKNQSCFIPK